MKHEKIIKRDDGSRIRITVTLSIDWHRDEPTWGFIVHKCDKGKRTWITPVDHDEYRWRRLGVEARRAEDHRRSLTLASEGEVESAMTELWQKIKPSL